MIKIIGHFMMSLNVAIIYWDWLQLSALLPIEPFSGTQEKETVHGKMVKNEHGGKTHFNQMARLVTYKCTSRVKSFGFDPYWALCRSRPWIPQSMKLPVNTVGSCHLRMDSLIIWPVDEKANVGTCLNCYFCSIFWFPFWIEEAVKITYTFSSCCLSFWLRWKKALINNHVWLEIVNFDNQNYRTSQGFCLKTFLLLSCLL